jgi:hypothetical protein
LEGLGWLLVGVTLAAAVAVIESRRFVGGWPEGDTHTLRK